MAKTIMNALIFVLGIAVVSSFGVGDHEKITKQAIQEIASCVSYQSLVSASDDVASANVWEDYNLWNKWVKGYSHFFSPYHIIKVCKLGICRKNADYRVSMLETTIEQGLKNVTDALENIGRVSHHLQDMCSPPHVVPVMHGLTDQFEDYTNKQFPPLQNDAAACQALKTKYAQLVATRTPSLPFLVHVMNQTAIATLNNLNVAFKMTEDNKPVTAKWGPMFWQECPGCSDGFGSYGALGNTFGSASIKNGTHVFTISDDVFELFKRQQLRQAIDASKIAFYWLFLASKA